MEQQERFNRMLEDNIFQVRELLRTNNIIYKKGDEQKALFIAYKKIGNKFAIDLTKIFANNSKINNYSIYETDLDPNLTEKGINEPPIKKNSSNFNNIFDTVTNVLTQGVNIFGNFQRAKVQGEIEKNKANYILNEQQRKEKQAQNILIIAVIAVIAIVALIIFKK